MRPQEIRESLEAVRTEAVNVVSRYVRLCTACFVLSLLSVCLYTSAVGAVNDTKATSVSGRMQEWSVGVPFPGGKRRGWLLNNVPIHVWETSLVVAQTERGYDPGLMLCYDSVVCGQFFLGCMHVLTSDERTVWSFLRNYQAILVIQEICEYSKGLTVFEEQMNPRFFKSRQVPQDF